MCSNDWTCKTYQTIKSDWSVIGTALERAPQKKGAIAVVRKVGGDNRQELIIWVVAVLATSMVGAVLHLNWETATFFAEIHEVFRNAKW